MIEYVLYFLWVHLSKPRIYMTRGVDEMNACREYGAFHTYSYFSCAMLIRKFKAESCDRKSKANPQKRRSAYTLYECYFKKVPWSWGVMRNA